MMDNAANLHLLQFQQVKCNFLSKRNSMQLEFNLATGTNQFNFPVNFLQQQYFTHGHL